jgi:hypothetical protein
VDSRWGNCGGWIINCRRKTRYGRASTSDAIPVTESQPPGQIIAASSLVDVLLADEDVEDVGALPVDQVPEWLNQLPILAGWQQVDLSDKPSVPLARMVVHGPRDDSGWAAAETVSVFSYTGWPIFGELLRHAGGTLGALGAVDVNTKVLSVPPVRWVAALRSSGTAQIGGHQVWVQQSNYVAGSEERRAGRLIVQSIFVDNSHRAELAPEIAQMSDSVYHGFVASIRDKSVAS